jgi:hypothetical protein
MEKRLIDFIRQHDGCAVIGVNDGKLIVESDAVEGGDCTLSATVVRVRELIPATLQAVRDWLGY